MVHLISKALKRFHTLKRVAVITTKHRVYLTKSNRKENIKVAQTDWRQGDYSRKSFLVDNSQQNEKEKATRCWPRHQMFRQVHVKTLRRHWYSVL